MKLTLSPTIEFFITQNEFFNYEKYYQIIKLLLLLNQIVC